MKSVGSNGSNGFRKTSPCFGKALPSTHSLHRIGEEWTGPAAGANDEEMTRYFANLSSVENGELNKKLSVRFMGESSTGSTGFQMFRPVSMTSCVSGISETSVKPRPLGSDSFYSPTEGSPQLAGSLSLKKSGQLAIRNLDDLDEDCVAEWVDDDEEDDIRNGGMMTNRSDYKDKVDVSPRSYQDNTESCHKLNVPDSMDDYDSDDECQGNRLELEGNEGDDECYGNDEECDSVVSHSLDDDDEDDLGDELIHLDDDLLASALEDLCVQRPRGDPTDWQWNVISDDLDIGSSLVCPASNENLKLGLRFGKAEAIGGRQYMEDRIFASSALPEEGTENFELAFFGVFDGHNGEYVADLLQTRMHVALLSHISAENVSRSLCDDGKSSLSEPSSPTTGGIAFSSDNEFSDSGGESKERIRSPSPCSASLGDCFVRTAAELDLQILTRDYQRQQCSLHTGTLDVQTFAGCVLATMTVTSAPNATHYIPLPANTNPTKTDMVSWIKRDKPPRWIRKDKAMGAGVGGVNVMVGHTGDCRAVLSEKGGVARVLTGDHKPQLASEKERIEVAGGWVHNNRVNGVLAVSRSFGDIQYKTFDGTTRFLTVDEKGGIWNKTQQVISKPDILEFSVDATHEFVVIASDGLWDVFTSQECINYVRWQLKQQAGDLTKTAEALVSAAFARGTADNTSVVIVAFNQLDLIDKRIDVSGSVSVCPVISPTSKSSKSPKVFIRLP